MLTSIGIALIALLVKWPALTMPLTGYFGSYQAMNAMMAEMMGMGSWVQLFIPQTFLLQGGAPALHLLYYPFGSLAAFTADHFLGGGIPWWGRAQAAFCMFGSSLLLFSIAKCYMNKSNAWSAVFFFSFFPSTLLCSILFQNESIALLFLLLSFWLLGQRSTTRSFLGGIFFSFALTARLHFIVALPAFLLFINSERVSIKNSTVFLVGVCIPLTSWVVWIRHLELTHASQVMTSLFSQSSEGRILKLSLFITPAFYKSLAKTFGAYCCTPLLAPVAAWSLFRFKRDRLVLLLWAWGALSEVFLIPQKVMDHPFYLLVGIPPLAILISAEIVTLWNAWNHWFKYFFCMTFVVLGLYIYWPPAFHVDAADHEVQALGHYVHSITREGDRVIAQHGSSPDLLYYCQRQGWPFDFNMIRSPYEVSHQERHARLLQLGYGDPMRWIRQLITEGATIMVISDETKLRQHPDLLSFLDLHSQRINSPFKNTAIYELNDRLRTA